MSSEASTESRQASTLRPWQFFVIAGLLAATAAVLLSAGRDPGHIVLITASVMAASLVGIAVYRTLWPLVAEDDSDRTEMLGGRTRAALEREKMLVLRSIKELEFDRAMGKIGDHDFSEMGTRLRARAIRLIGQLDEGASGYRELIERELAARLGRASPAPAGTRESVREHAAPRGEVVVTLDEADTSVRGTAARAVSALQCASCGALNDMDARFCKSCGRRFER